MAEKSYFLVGSGESLIIYAYPATARTASFNWSIEVALRRLVFASGYKYPKAGQSFFLASRILAEVFSYLFPIELYITWIVLKSA